MTVLVRASQRKIFENREWCEIHWFLVEHANSAEGRLPGIVQFYLLFINKYGTTGFCLVAGEYFHQC